MCNIPSYISRSRRNHGRTIQQLIGGHVLFTRETLRNLRNINVKHNNNSAAAFNYKTTLNFTENNHLDDGLQLIAASAGNGKIEKETNNSKKDESKKTLSDQVAEGKYGLIHKELFQTTPNRPGVLSYKSNLEVPKDDARNYGGLKDEEIWLAEDYLLVIKGGFVNKNSNKPKWKPIDDYKAPTRQVKLPLNPKVPPPFPVQLTDNGPIQFIGNNKLPSYNPFTNQTVFLFSNERVPHIKADDLNKKSTPPWNGKDSTPPQFNGYQYPPPAPLPPGKQNHTFSNPFLNLPPLPISGSIDEQNNTYIDEDDPSLYYPPPYSFEYKNNYSNPVSPGPLVPGIILPPPPNFFASLENEKIAVKKPLDVLDKITNNQQKELKSQINSTTVKSVKCKPITIETPSYKIEIEKVNVKKFPENNEIVSTLRPANQLRFTTTSQPTKKSSRTKPHLRTRTQLHRVNSQISHPLISLSPDNFKGNPIYFEYFDAQAPMLESFHDYSITTSVPYLTTLTNEGHNYKTTTENPLTESLLNQKRYPSKTFLPDEDKGLYVAPDLGNYRYKTMQAFNREIETIKQTLRLYENSLPIISNLRTPKAQRPVYKFSFDYRQSISPAVQSYPSSLKVEPFNHQLVPNQPVDRPLNENFYNQHSLNSQPFQQIPLQHFEKPDHHNYNYRNHLANVEITSANPSSYTSFTTSRPFYYTQPSWYSIDKVRVHEIPKPLIYNNGASGYNTKLYLPGKSTYKTNVSSKTAVNQSSQQYKDNPVSQLSSVRQKHKYSSRNQQQTNEGHLDRDTLINYKHPLPAIDPDSELLPYNGRKLKPIIQYQLPSDKANVYFITPQELKYS